MTGVPAIAPPAATTPDCSGPMIVPGLDNRRGEARRQSQALHQIRRPGPRARVHQLRRRRVGVLAAHLAGEPVVEEIGDHDEALGRSTSDGVCRVRGEELIDRVDRHELHAGGGVDLVPGHDVERRRPWRRRCARRDSDRGSRAARRCASEQRVVDAPRVDGRCRTTPCPPTSVQRVPHLAPQRVHVPAQRSRVCARACSGSDGARRCGRARPRGAPERRGRFRRRDRTQGTCSGSLRPYDIAPYAQQGSGQRHVHSGSQYRAARRRSRRTTTTWRGSSARRGVDAETLVERAMAFRVAVPSWGVGVGRHPVRAVSRLPGEPRNVFEKLEDCEVVFRLTRVDAGHLAAHSVGQAGESRRAARVRPRARAVLRLDELEHVSGSAGTAAVVQVRQPQPHRCGSAAAGDRAQPRMSRDRRGARRARAYGVDWRRRQFSRPAALPAGARSVSRQHEGDLSRACRTTGGCSSSTSSTSRRSIRRC